MRILLVSATAMEVAPTLKAFGINEQKESGRGRRGQGSVTWLSTGLGMTATALELALYLSSTDTPYDLAIQVGIAGAIDRQLPLASIVQVTAETIADLGAEDADGSFLSPSEMGFPPPPPFTTDGWLRVETYPGFEDCPSVHGATVNRVTGSEKSSEALRQRLPRAAVESMEGAAFFLVCQRFGLACVQLRSISNYVGIRDRKAWRIGEAVGVLNRRLLEFLAPVRAEEGS